MKEKGGDGDKTTNASAKGKPFDININGKPDEGDEDEDEDEDDDSDVDLVKSHTFSAIDCCERHYALQSLYVCVCDEYHPRGINSLTFN